MFATRCLFTGLFLLGACVLHGAAQETGTGPGISLDDLLNIEISSAAKYAQTSSEAAASVTVITQDDIQRFGYRTLSEALVQVRGFYGSYDRNYFYLGARGFGRPTDYNNRILLLMDGQPLNENFYGSASLGGELSVNLDMVERIEVVRGPGSALYGSNAMFAVVNVVSRAGGDIQGTEVWGEVGSFGQKRGAATFGRKFDNGLELMVSGNWFDAAGQDLYFAEFDDPSTNNGVAEGLDWERSAGGYALARYGPFSVRGLLVRQEKGVPTAAWGTLFNVDQHTMDGLWSLDARFEQDVGVAGNLMIRAYSSGYDYDGVYPYEDDEVEDDGNVGRWNGAEVQFRWDPVPSNRLTVGSEFRRNTEARYYWRLEDEVYFDGSFPFSLFSAYVQDELNLTHNLIATAGARLDHHSEVGSAVSPRAALVYHPTDATTLKALFGQAFRAPNSYELDYDDGWIVGNPDLEPERIRTLEAVLERRLSQEWFLSVALFDYHVWDIIDQIEIDAEEELYQHQNEGDVNAQGIEVELRAMLESGLSGYASHVYQAARTSSEGDIISNSPRNSFRAGASLPLRQGVFLSASVLHDSERMTVQETAAESFTVANLTFLARGQQGRLEASLSIRNIFDESYVTPGGWEHEMPAISQDGRSIAFRVGLKF